jgi:hypothetical protein
MANKPEKVDVNSVVNAATRKSAAQVIRKMLAQRDSESQSRANAWIDFCEHAKIPERGDDESATDWNRKVRAVVDDIATLAGLSRKANPSDVSRMTTFAKCAPKSLAETKRALAADKRVAYNELTLVFAASRIANGKPVKAAVTETVKHFNARKAKPETVEPRTALFNSIVRFCKYASNKGTVRDVELARKVADAFGKKGYDAILKSA